jgi:tetratricopeptide (TPR) repeat protein
MNEGGPSLFLNDLRKQIIEKRAIVVVGAGVSAAATNGHRYATWKELLRSGVHRCTAVANLPQTWVSIREQQIDSGEANEMVSAAEEVTRVLRSVRGEYPRWLRETVGELHKQIVDPTLVKTIGNLTARFMTTNYDSVLEAVLTRDSLTWRQFADVDRWARGEDSSGILHLHGHHSDEESVVLGIRSYEDVIRNEHTVAVLNALWTTHTLIFIGYGAGLDDPNFSRLLQWARTAHPRPEHRHYRLVLGDDAAKIEKDDQIVAISYGDSFDALPRFLSSLGAAASSHAESVTQQPVFNVPFPAKKERVIGRDRALAAVRHALETQVTPYGSVAAVVGIGGLGKTQTAVEYCYARRGDYVDGVVWIDCAREIDPQLVVIGEAAGWVHPDATASEKVALATKRLARLVNVLIVLDDVTDIEPIERQFFSPAEPARHYLITSRNPIPGPTPVDTKQLALDQEQAIELLRKESSRDTITEADPNAIELVTMFGFLPLAIEIAGAYLRQRPAVPLNAYVQSIRDRGLDAPGMAPTRLDSYTHHAPRLREAVEITDAVFVDEPLLPRILSCFGITPGTSISRSLLAAMLDVEENDVELLAALGRAETLRIISSERTGTGDRWRMHQLVWQVYRDRAATQVDEGEAIQFAERVTAWFHIRHEDVSALLEMETEVEHLRFWRERLPHERQMLAARMLWLEAYLGYHRAQFQTALSFLQRALEISEACGHPDLELCVRIHADYATLTLGTDSQCSLRHGFQAAALAADLQSGQDDARAHALLAYAHVQANVGDYAEALKTATDVVGLDLPARRRAYALESLASFQVWLGLYEVALQTVQEALLLTDTVRDFRARIEQSAGEIYTFLDRTPEAILHVKKAHEIYEAVYGSEHPATLSAVAALARLYRESDCEKAMTLVNTMLRVAPRVLNDAQLAAAYQAAGAVVLHCGEPADAVIHLSESNRLYRARYGEGHPEVALAATWLARAFVKTGKSAEAEVLLRSAIDVQRRFFGEAHPELTNTIIHLSSCLWHRRAYLPAYTLLHKHMQNLPTNSDARKDIEARIEQMRMTRKIPGVRAVARQKKK